MKTKKQEHSDAKPKVEHTPTPWRLLDTRDGIEIVSKSNRHVATIFDSTRLEGIQDRPNAELIVRAVNGYDELLEAAKSARNVLAGLVTGDLKEVRADSPALQSLRRAIAKAEGSPSSHKDK